MVNNSTHTTHDVMDLLSQIPDPEIPVINIRDLGMLREVRLEDNTYVVTITPTYTACPAMKMVEDQIRELCQAKGISNLRVDLTYSPAWSTDWISAEAREKLRQYGIAPPQRTACSKVFAGEAVACPKCGSRHTALISRFGSTACKSLHSCKTCLEPFEYFKCH